MSILDKNDNLPIKTDEPIHAGKVRAVYWLSKKESQRLIVHHNYPVHEESELAVMVISDRISAFDCVWRGEGDLSGVPGKGAALNAISAYWFDLFKKNNLANHHIIETPHPLIWIVQKSKPLQIEAIVRQYITGSMWRTYDRGERVFCGFNLPDQLQKNQKLPELLITPSTKGIIKNIPTLPEIEDCSISRALIEQHLAAFHFKHHDDLDRYEYLLKKGFHCIEQTLEPLNHLLVDTKFEFGYVKNQNNEDELIYIDEVGTPDSSRFWEANEYKNNTILELSKESFRQHLMKNVPDSDVLLNADRMKERIELASTLRLPHEVFIEISKIYCDLAASITGQSISISPQPREEMLDILNDYQLII
ncbi:MAG: phosphoribosylaminoimidazolesuccinocarboxamide synthase [Endozoicomonadaceae bacterium]|nr:phosphoribosylaminoimidazolesuccinocarboxamide synthase [Endozoicomonadaceae bacterium]